MLSVVIPTRDKRASLRATLRGLAAQRCPVDYEVVVVDDGCVDGTQELLATAAGWFAGALRTVGGPSRGRAAARNAGAAAARGERLLFLDDDLLTGPGHLAAHHRPGVADVFAHGPLREFPGARRWLGEQEAATDVELEARITAVLSGRAGRLLSNTLESLINAMAAGVIPPVASWAACVGANTSVPRDVFERAGGFDEEFGRGWGCEDLELGVRLTAAGLRPVVLADAAGVHLTHARPDRWTQHDVNLARFVRLHPLPSVRYLDRLLGEAGSVRAYVAACVGTASQ
ncbi:glycosyltransferase [Micromonospora chokoriensis]